MGVERTEFAVLYKTERRRLEHQIFRRVGCRSTACDLVHDIFLRLWEKATERTSTSPAYLTRCARNAAVDHARSERSRRNFVDAILPEQYAAPVPTPFDVLSARQRVVDLDTALARLPERTRHIFLLNRVHGRTFDEIAAAFAISQRAVAKHMARALSACEGDD